MKTEKELLAILNINENILDEELNEQPKLVFTYASRVADARQELEEAIREMQVAKAELGLRVRENPADYGLEKATEGSVAQVLETRLSAEHQKIATRKHDLEIMQGFLEALQHRKKSLELKTQLILTGWTGQPKLPADQKKKLSDRTFDRCKLPNRKDKK